MNILKEINKKQDQYKKDTDFNNLFTLIKDYDHYILGGFIRDIFEKKQSKDIDILIDISDENLFEIVKNFKYKKNSFGAYKLILNNIEVDIWNTTNHFYFKNLMYEYKKGDLKNIANTCFINYDALIYYPNKENYYVRPFFNAKRKGVKFIRSKHKTYISTNLTKITNTLKLLLIQEKYKLNKNVIKYINENLKTYKKQDFVDAINKYEKYQSLTEKINKIYENEISETK